LAADFFGRETEKVRRRHGVNRDASAFEARAALPVARTAHQQGTQSYAPSSTHNPSLAEAPADSRLEVSEAKGTG